MMSKILSIILMTVILCGCALTSQDLPKLYQNSINAVVSIHIRETNYHTGETAMKMIGSGFIIDSRKGIIITAAHVVGINQSCQVELQTGLKIVGIIEAIDLSNDIAFIKVNPGNFPRDTPNLIFDLNPIIGEPLFCIGSPGSVVGTVSLGILSSGLIIETDPMLLPRNFYLSDVHIFGGSSGCPVFNLERKVVGMVVQFFGGYTLMIPAKVINEFLNQNAN